MATRVALGAAAAAALGYAAYKVYRRRRELASIDIVKKAYTATAVGEESCCVTA